MGGGEIQNRNGPPGFSRRRGGFTLPEILVVLTLMAVMIAMAAPSFQKAVEKAKADVAIANLRAVWAAERFFWLDNRAYTANLGQLVTLDLLNAELTAGTSPYVYTVSTSIDGETFVATATHITGSSWSGSFTIDQTGTVGGKVTSPGDPDILPPSM
jgi:prepilin-type N-terminal cleavage/methylation domain-containing protein